MSKSYCLKCQKEVGEDVKECSCGSRSFIYGSKFSLVDGKVVCDCGSDVFHRNMHLDYENRAVSNFYCDKCNNPVGTEYYRTEEEIMLRRE